MKKYIFEFVKDCSSVVDNESYDPDKMIVILNEIKKQSEEEDIDHINQKLKNLEEIKFYTNEIKFRFNIKSN